jgi:ubiquinone/menaquinone biosynthesis C-methylase UbiE
MNSEYQKIKKEYNFLHKRRFEERLLKNKGDIKFVFLDKLRTKWHQIVIELLEDYNLKNKNILEVGCGYGSLSVFLAKREARVTGIDISSEAIKISKRNTRLFRQKINFIEANAIDIPFKDKKFDITICCDTLEHIPDYKKAIKELIRVTKKGGLILITTPNIMNPKGLYLKRTSRQPIENAFNYWTIKRELKSRGLKIKKVLVKEYFTDRDPKLLEKILSNSPFRIFGLRIGILARR